MATRGKTFLIAFAGASLALGVLLAIFAITVYQHGMLRVQVRSAGDNVNVICPGIIVPAAMHFVPDRAFGRVSAEFERMSPEVRAALHELGDVPDCVLVEVRNARENVKIAKQGRLLVIDVNSPDETVHVSLPLKTLDCVIGKMQSAAAKNARNSKLDEDTGGSPIPTGRRASESI